MNISVKEFTPSLMNKDESSVSANCHVVINNGPVETNTNDPTTSSSTTTTTHYPSVNTMINPELSDHLAKCFSSILKTNNAKLIANIIDMSGKVIISIEDLAKAISLITNQSYNDVKISYVENDTGCCAKINPIHAISKIKIGTQDFNLNWNNEYNILEDTYNISLTKCYIAQAITYGL